MKQRPVIANIVCSLLCLTALAVSGKSQDGAQSKKMSKVDSQKVAHTMEVGMRAFEHCKYGLANGEWQPFLAMLSDDFTFYFPQGKYKGQNTGKAKAEEFFKYVSATFVGGLKVTEVMHVTAGENSIVFEFKDEGSLRGEAYKNRVAISWEIRGDQLISYREYFGSDGKSN